MIRRLVRAFAIALAIAAARVPAAATPGIGPGTIAALVRDAAGKPVAGALVVAAGPTSREATTGAAGFATLVALPLGTYSVRVTRAGFRTIARRLDVTSDPRASVLDLHLARTSLADLRGAASALATVPLDGNVDARVDAALSAARDVLLQPVHGVRDGVALALAGTSGDETRVELDGIPLAGGPTAFAALRYRNAFALSDVDLVDGPGVTATTVRDAIGGIVDYRTPDLGGDATAGLAFGYSSSFGAFQHARALQHTGRLDVLADAVTGGGDDRSQVLAARYALSGATTLGVASYGSQASATLEGIDVASVAPALSADLRTTLGNAVLQARAFESSASSSSVLGSPQGLENQSDRIRGVQAGLDVPFGEDVASIAFDRRTERAALAGVAVAQTFTSLAARADLRLASLGRLELGDDYAGGTDLPQRHDPHLALALRPSRDLTIRVSAGSAYATAPEALRLAAAADDALRPPETSFGYRLGIDDDLGGGAGHLFASLAAMRRFDRFATYADARSLGLDLGFARSAPPEGGIGADAYAEFERAVAYGPVQPSTRVAETLVAQSLDALAGDPYLKLNARVAYRSRGGLALALRSTLLGANNALAAHAVAFADAALTLPTPLGDVHVGENNMFGTTVAEPLLAPFYAPHEITVLFATKTR